MEEDKEQELTDSELDALLREWKTPPLAARLRAKLFAAPRADWWHRFWGASIRIPIPAAACILVLLALGAWRWLTPGTQLGRVIVKQQRVEVPFDSAGMSGPLATAFGGLRPVAVLQPRIIRSRNAHK